MSVQATTGIRGRNKKESEYLFKGMSGYKRRVKLDRQHVKVAIDAVLQGYALAERGK